MSHYSGCHFTVGPPLESSLQSLDFPLYRGESSGGPTVAIHRVTDAPTRYISTVAQCSEWHESRGATVGPPLDLPVYSGSI